MPAIPNIYASRRVKYYAAVPLILLAIGLYLWLFSGRFILDSSLTGGVSVIIQSNTTISSSQIASEIATKLHSPLPSIERSPGGLQITIATNKSIASGETDSLAFYSSYQNYTAALVNVTALSGAIESGNTNKSVASQLAVESGLENKSASRMSQYLSAELTDLQPFIGMVALPSSVSQQVALSQSAYTNASTNYTNSVISALHSIMPFTTYSYQELGPTLGSFFLGQLVEVIIFAFVLVSLAVLFIFRSVVPALTVVFGAANDMIIALGAMALFGIPLGTASIGGLLMIIGYSIDTDVLASYRILKTHGGTPEERAFSSMKTGLTMTATALVSFSVLFIVSIFTYVPTYYEVAGVALLGLLGDIFTTWLGNTPLILMYRKRKER